MMEQRITQDELWRLRALIQRIGWRKFMFHIGSLMAEQADNVPRDSPQDSGLFNCSVAIHKLDPVFAKLGFFDYRNRHFIPDEYRDLLEANAPAVETIT